MSTRVTLRPFVSTLIRRCLLACMRACTKNTRQILDVSCNQLADLPTSVSTLKSLQVNGTHRSLHGLFLPFFGNQILTCL